MTTSQTDFVRRPNSDGTIDSICIKCQLTIATATWKADLDSAEQDHRDLFRLEYLRKSVKNSMRPENPRKECRLSSLWLVSKRRLLFALDPI